MNLTTPTEILTGVLVVITGIYAYLTRGIMRATKDSVEAMREQTVALSRPYVTITPFTLPQNPILFLRITNTGKSPAESLDLKLDRSFFMFGKDTMDLAKLSAFTTAITSFAPGAELIFGLAQAFVVFGDQADAVKTPTVFKVTASYTFLGRTVTEVTEVDLRPFEGMHMAYDPIVDELSEIKDVLKKMQK